METHAFASLAHIRILLLPVGLISRTAFETYAAELRSFTTLRLADIPAETKDGKGTGAPTLCEQFLISFSHSLSA